MRPGRAEEARVQASLRPRRRGLPTVVRSSRVGGPWPTASARPLPRVARPPRRAGPPRRDPMPRPGRRSFPARRGRSCPTPCGPIAAVDARSSCRTTSRRGSKPPVGACGRPRPSAPRPRSPPRRCRMPRSCAGASTPRGVGSAGRRADAAACRHAPDRPPDATLPIGPGPGDPVSGSGPSTIDRSRPPTPLVHDRPATRVHHRPQSTTDTAGPRSTGDPHPRSTAVDQGRRGSANDRASTTAGVGGLRVRGTSRRRSGGRGRRRAARRGPAGR